MSMIYNIHEIPLPNIDGIVRQEGESGCLESIARDRQLGMLEIKYCNLDPNCDKLPSRRDGGESKQFEYLCANYLTEYLKWIFKLSERQNQKYIDGIAIISGENKKIQFKTCDSDGRVSMARHQYNKGTKPDVPDVQGILYGFIHSRDKGKVFLSFVPDEKLAANDGTKKVRQTTTWNYVVESSIDLVDSNYITMDGVKIGDKVLITERKMSVKKSTVKDLVIDRLTGRVLMVHVLLHRKNGSVGKKDRWRFVEDIKICEDQVKQGNLFFNVAG